MNRKPTPTDPQPAAAALAPPVLLGLAALLALAAWLAPVIAAAAEADRSQPIEVRADRSHFDELQGLQTHTGDVVITQGSLRIEADEIVIKLANGALHSIDASGAPTTFRQLDDLGREVRTRSRKMHYATGDGLLLLTGDAHLSQPGRELSGERIEYHVDAQTVSADGGGDEGGERVRIVIQPPPPADSEGGGAATDAQ